VKYLIIGASHAGIACVEGIRSQDAEGQITLLSKEGHRPYGRPLISYYLEGKTDLEHISYRPESFFADHGAELRLNTEVLSIDAAQKTVRTAAGEEIPYDKLLVATGSVPFVPPMEGLESVEKKAGFLNLDDALRLESLINEKSRVLIIGAGLIGTKCAEGIAERVASVSIVEMMPRVLPAVLDEDCAAIVQAKMEENNCRFYLGDSVERFTGNSAKLKSGETVEFDVLVLAVGVRPNTALLQAAGAEIARGVKVDSHMQTSLPGVYAAGDLTLSHDVSDGGSEKVLAVLPNAYTQGYTAGQNMAGLASNFENAFPMNAGGFFGLHLITAGSYQGECLILPNEGGVKKLFIKDDRLVGYLLLGDVRRAGIYTSLIRDQTPLSTIDFGLIAQKPQLMAFSKAERAKMLAGGNKA
jgi:NAD(P)H-nitrite reductase large subunit